MKLKFKLKFRWHERVVTDGFAAACMNPMVMTYILRKR
jgi:hypothetical protein